MISRTLSNWRAALVNGRSKFAQTDCVLCGARTGPRAVCAACGADLPWTAGGCPVCGNPGENRLCGECLREPPSYDRCIAALHYAFPADELIQALKYGGQLALAPVLADFLARAVMHAPRPDLLLPMPLFPARARERGFNQATEIARALARRLGLRLDTASLERTRDTLPQARLSLAERRHNVCDAFTCQNTVAGLHVALVDDVMTSGATLNEAAKAVKRAGAAEVSVWVVARAVTRR